MYLMGLDIAISGEGAANDKSSAAFRKECRLLAPHRPTVQLGFDPKEVRDALVSLGPLESADFSSLTMRLIVAGRFYVSMRAKDLESMPILASTVALLDSDSFPESLVIWFHLTKQSRSKREDIERSGWSGPITVQALRVESLIQFGNLAPEFASKVAERCCFVRILFCYLRLTKNRWHKQGFSVGSKLCFARHTLIHARSFSSAVPMKYLGAQRINKYISAFHNEHFSSTCGSGKDFEARHWRHVSSSALHSIGKSQDAIARLLHESESTFISHYRVKSAPSFLQRWSDLSPSLRDHLSVEEALLV